MNLVDITRHIEVFSPDAFGSRRIDVIGGGASGSHITRLLAKLGLTNIHVWDFDKVEAHNVGNQAFSQEDIGKLKVDALRDIVKRDTGLEIHTHNERVDGTQELGDVVFLLTDTMASRKQIWDKAIRYKMRTKLLIETRMGSDNGRVYTINPMKPNQVKGYEANLYTDEVAEVSACGASISVGPTAEYLAGLAVWQLIRWQNIQQGKRKDGKEGKLDHEIIFGLDPLYFLLANFE